MYPTTGQTNTAGALFIGKCEPRAVKTNSLTDDLAELNNSLCELREILQSIEVTVNGCVPHPSQNEQKDYRPGLGGRVDSMRDTVREAIAVANRVKSDLG